MEANTAAIIRLAWERMLELGDGALSESSNLSEQSDRAILAERPDRVTVLRLWDRQVLLGPGWFLDRVRDERPDELDGRRLLAATLDHGGRLLGEAVLAYTDSYVERDGLEQVTATDDGTAVVDLEKACPPDDVAEVGLAEMSRALVTLDELDVPTAGAGYDEWELIIGQLGVLTPPGRRGQGFGTMAAALATNDALDAGLVPQWRARIENAASRRLAARLGFVEVGTQTTVMLPRPEPATG